MILIKMIYHGKIIFKTISKTLSQLKIFILNKKVTRYQTASSVFI